MALFSRKKKTETTEKEAAKAGAATSRADLSHVLVRPRITEKATGHQAQSVYTFDIAAGATKQQVRAAIEQYYKVRPRMVRVVTIPAKSVRSMRTGVRGVKQGGKKAYVYLKAGESITIT